MERRRDENIMGGGREGGRQGGREGRREGGREGGGLPSMRVKPLEGRFNRPRKGRFSGYSMSSGRKQQS